MTTTLGSWIDNEALADVIDDLCPPRSTPEEKAPPTTGAEPKPGRYAPEVGLEPGDLHRPEFYGESKFPGFSGARDSAPLESIRAPKAKKIGAASLKYRLATLKQRAERSGLIETGGGGDEAPAQETKLASDEFAPSNSGLNARLTEFVLWAKEKSNARHLCLSNSIGEPLTDDEAPVGLAQAAAIMANALISAGENFPLASSAHVSIGRNQVLTTVAVREANRIFAIAVIGGAPLSDSLALNLRKGLLSALQSDSISP